MVVFRTRGRSGIGAQAFASGARLLLSTSTDPLDDPARPSPPLRRRLGGAALVGYCAIVVLLGLPWNARLPALDIGTGALLEVLEDYGINPWHRVFAGKRGTDKRRRFALRVSATTTDGDSVVLHESPPGLTDPLVRLFDNIRTTASFKAFGLTPLGTIMYTREDAEWAEELESFRNEVMTRRFVAGFCRSSTLNGGTDVRQVGLEIFTAGIDYNTGEQYARGTKVVQVDCASGAVTDWTGPADHPPTWPDVTWRTVR